MRLTLKMCTLLDLNSILAEIAARIQPLVGDKLVLGTRLDPNLAHIKADPKQIDWLFVNLAADAYDAMPGGGQLVITTANVELKPQSAREINLPPGQYVQVELSVAGGGLRAGPTARNIIQQIRGAVRVRENSGSVVVEVLLPRAMGPVPLQRSQRTHGSMPVVLVVSGSSSSRASMRDVLLDAGYAVVEAANGEQAEAVLTAGDVDLMITDIVTPEQDGLETILSVRAVYPGLKIIALAESEAGYQLRTAKQLGADSVMPKPLTRRILCDAVRDQIGAAS